MIAGLTPTNALLLGVIIGLIVGFPLGWVICAIVAGGAEQDARIREMLDKWEAQDELRDR